MNKNQLGNENTLFPVFLKLEQMAVILIGGGTVGTHKLQTILENSPMTRITLVAKEISATIRNIASSNPRLVLKEQAFTAEDLINHDIVFIAIDDSVVSREIREQARAKNILVNSADMPDLCDFYLSSVVRKGQLKIAISSNGQSPTIARRLRELFEHVIPIELDQVITNLNTIRNNLGADLKMKIKQLNKITASLVDNQVSTSAVIAADTSKNIDSKHQYAKYQEFIPTLILLGFVIFLGLIWFFHAKANHIAHPLAGILTWEIYVIFIAGFFAQLINGAFGMGYGTTCSSVLQALGIVPVVLSSSIHNAEMVAAGINGYNHYKFRNIKKWLFKSLTIYGIIGAISGAILVTKIASHMQYIRLGIAFYTTFLGLNLLYTALKTNIHIRESGNFNLLALVSGFLDSVAGGGWGTLVTSTLVKKGVLARYAVGTTNLSRFFVTFASSVTFFFLIGFNNLPITIALIVSGIIASPFAAKLTGKFGKKTGYWVVGTVVSILSIYTLITIGTKLLN